MYKSKINKRLKNLEKVKVVIEIAKIDTIKKITDSINIKNLHYKMSETSQKIINYSQSLEKSFKKLNWFKKNEKIKKTLWLFITIPTKLIKVSYQKYERILENKIDINNDIVIPVGDPAINFVNKKKYKVLTKFSSLKETDVKVASIVMHMININKFSYVNVISYSEKTKDNYYQIYPFENIKYQPQKMKKMKFFYSLSDTIDQISYNYIKNIISGLYQESYRNFYAEKLVKYESALKTIDEKIYESKLLLIKNERKKETDEMINVIQSTKRR